MSDVAKGLLQYDLITFAISVIVIIVISVWLFFGGIGKKIIRNMQKRIWGQRRETEDEDEDEEINS